ncbi:UNVERIFIED_CONTAM: hypothetical protein HDU68_012921 [Siphonaria sp. JEL0065]|nr:hypothetical protein HDU68_012921 [Siphonaria sp. JEL0065]
MFGVRSLNTLRVRSQTRFVSTIKPFYTAESTATGGRDGFVKGTEGFQSKMVLPVQFFKGPGASATAQNPEVLFASGILLIRGLLPRSCQSAAGQLKITVPKDATVTVKTHLGNIETNGSGFGLAVDIIGKFPGLDKAQARALVDKAHNEICPYSKATRGNIVVNVSVE